MALRRAHLWAWGIGLLLAAGPLARVAHALDTITLTSGLIMEGDIIAEEDTQIKLRVKGRVMTFPRDSIESIEYGPDSTAPSQVKERKEQTEEELEETQKKVKAIKVKARPPEKKKKKEDEVLPAAAVDANASLVVPDEPTEEEKALITQLREGPDKRGAARELGQRRALVAIPALIRALDDDSPYTRGEAMKALRDMTGKNFGFNPTQRNRSIRLEAIKRWQDWYEDTTGKRVPW